MKQVEVKVTMKVEVKNGEGVVRNYETAAFAFLRDGDTFTTINDRLRAVGAMSPLVSILTHAVRDFGLNDGPEE
jgi:hypothetical protein